MAKRVLYSVYDKKTGSFDDARPYASQAMAHRAFIGAFRDPQGNMLQEYPSDFNLVYIGEFDTETGKIDLDNALVTSMEGTEAMNIALEIDKRRALQNVANKPAKGLEPEQKHEADQTA